MPYSTLFQRLLKIRGLTEDSLKPDYTQLPDPYLIEGVPKATIRIQQAVKNRETIVIYGDYDVDGVCASTLMHDALTAAGADPNNITILLPDRFADGYGLGTSAIPKILKTQATLVITVDCGSSSEPVIADLKSQNIDTIVTDHHEIPNIPKSALAVINPKRPNPNPNPTSLETPSNHLSGTGVAFQLARALNQTQNHGILSGQEKWLLDLVAIGTICDSMPLTQANRTLVYWGLRVLAKTRRPGLKELMKIAQIDPQKLSTHAIGFQIGPRLNAAGRLDSAHKSLRLLMSKSRPEAFKLATELDQLNKTRREVQNAALLELDQPSITKDPVIIVKGNWHEGIIGIIAGRLVELHQKPAFVLTEIENGLLKGSGRSFGGFKLADCITHCQNLLAKGGGHDYACGLTIANSNFAPFTTTVNNFYKSLNLKNQARFLQATPDLHLENFTDLTETLCEELKLLEPYGEANPEPILATTAKIFNAKILKEKHLSLSVRDSNGRFLRLLAFFAPKNWLHLEENATIRIKFTPTLNEWNGRRSVEGRLLELEQI